MDACNYKRIVANGFDLSADSAVLLLMNDEEYKGFLIIRQTYSVKCKQCGFRGKAKLGKEPIQDIDAGGAEFCPVCGHLALAADDGKNK